MPARRNTHLERILGRVDDLDESNLAILVRRLARERGLLESVFNTIREGILVIDREGLIEYANQAGLRLVGLKETDVGEASLWKIAPDLTRTLNLDLDSVRRRESLFSREIEIHYPEHVFVRVSIVPFESEALGDRAARERFVMIVSDITEEKLSSEERLESERLASIFMLAGGVAHEIGNPLNSLNIHLQLIQRQLRKLGNSGARDKIEKSTEVCAREVERLDGIIANFLQAVRPQAPDFRELDLLEALEAVLEVQRTELENLGIAVDVRVSETLPVILADANQIQQVLFNLIKNAVEAMGQGGRLRINARSDDEFVYLLVADTGSGIAPEELAKVFQPYFTTKTGGHGLGMMIVQRILRAHGAQIGIDSEPGTGTVVTLQFPQTHRRMRMLADG
ncbi:MAG: nitrogen regulation protein NR(II) [Opitutales bacterium]